MSSPELSIIIPVYNEEPVLPRLLSELTNIKSLPAKHEIIFVDDGSTDKSKEILSKRAKKDKLIKLVSFTRNFGQQPAISAGLRFATGKYVGIMDADLQDPPNILVKMYGVLKKEKVDIVYSVRKERDVSLLKKALYKFFYSLYSYTSESPVNIDSGDFSVMTKRVVDGINSMPEKTKFIRGLRSWAGYSSISYEIDRPARAAGSTKYSWGKLYELAINGITSTSTKPLRLATLMGVLLGIASTLMIVIYSIRWLVLKPNPDVPGFPTIVFLILFFSGTQLFTLGVLGEYIATIFLEVKGRPSYLVDNTINC